MRSRRIPPATRGKNQSRAERQAQKVAIALSKARGRGGGYPREAKEETREQSELLMADTATLKPLTRREKLELSPDTDRELLDQARERFALAEEAEATERSQQLDALKFRAGDHWPAALRQDNMGEASEQLTMVIDRLNPMIQQTINAYRKSPLAMRVRPKGGGASKQVADMIEGHLRDIEQQSEAEIAYTIALDQAVGQGLGYFRLVREYEDERSFQQVLRIKAVYNRFSVYMDPASVHPAGS